MRMSIRLYVLILQVILVGAQTGNSAPGGVLQRFSVAQFAGSGSDAIQAMTSDAEGNLYIAGTTSSPDLPMKHAVQPVIGEAPLMRSLDRGLTWQKMSTSLTKAITIMPLVIAPHPSDPQTLIAGGLDGIYKTSDGGMTWRQTYTFRVFYYPGWRDVFNIAVDPANPRHAYAFVSTGLFLVSSDSGETWQVQTPPPTAYPLAISNGPPQQRVLWVDPNGSGTVALGFSLSDDHGLTWQRMTDPPNFRPSFPQPSFTVPDPRHAGWIYAVTSETEVSGRLYLSTDWGVTWSEKAEPESRGAIHNLVVDPDVPNALYTEYLGYIYISNDSANSWRKTIGLGRPFVVPRQCIGGALLGLDVLGGSGFSTDFGTTWKTGRVSQVLDMAMGPGCAVYAARPWTADAFIAKLSPGGREVLWSTFLGGTDADAPVAIALDGQGSVYVTGSTSSLDFPTTQSRIGPNGSQSLFAVKLDTDGNLLYSVVLGGLDSGTVMAMAVNSQGDAHLVGRTLSVSFPATPGAFQTQASGGYNGFAVKLGADGRVRYASYLPDRSNLPVAVALEASGSALIGYGTILSRVASDGSKLTEVSRLPGQIFAMETDSKGYVYVAGQTNVPPLGSQTCFPYFHGPSLPPGDIFVTKLEPESLQQLYSARLFGVCQSWPGRLNVGATGELTVGLLTGGGTFPLRNPVLASPSCGVVSRLSADGSKLLFSSYLDTCGTTPVSAINSVVFNKHLRVPPIALGPDDSLYVGVTSYPPHGGILRLPVPPPMPMSVERAIHAFSGFPGSVAPGMLLTIAGQKLAPESIDLGLNNAEPLPTELGGVHVLFDNEPAQILQVAPDHVVCVVPVGVKDSVTVQVVNGDDTSTPFVLLVQPYQSGFPGLLTRSFPAPPPDSSADGYVRNTDGTLNDAGHPAAQGSTVTLYATGLSGPGPVEMFWDPPPGRIDYWLTKPVYGSAEHAPGMISAVYEIKFKIPDSLGPGVTYLPTPGVLTRVEILLWNRVGVYVQ